MNVIDTFRMDKNTFSVTSLFDESDEKAYWLSKTSYERLEAMEFMRQINYGYDPTTARIQRILEVVELTRHKDLDDLEHLSLIF
ncbi:hypothetical protein HYR99_38295 [Candidatus Poribacteria bacterium]|nr:hypothetical protein [Candidatus Poribacteria bacterium]